MIVINWLWSKKGVEPQRGAVGRLAPQGLFSLLSDTLQACLPRDDPVLSRMGPPTSTINQENTQQPHPEVRMFDGVSSSAQVFSSSQVTLACVK